MFVVYFCLLMSGINLGWLAPVLKKSENPDYGIFLTNDQKSWIAALQDPFKICGLIGGALFVDIFGRKKLLFISSIFNMSGWIAISLTKSITIMYISRLAFGVASGLEDLVSAIYICENGSPHYRGVFVTICGMCFSGGMITEIVLATYLSYYSVAIINVIIAFIQLLSFVLAKETPNFLIMNGQYEEAEKNYRSLISNDKNDFMKLKENVLRVEESPHFTELFTKSPYYKSILTTITLTIIMFSSGYWSLIPFLSITFSSSSHLTSNEFTIIFSSIQFVSIVAASFLIERFKRRTILLLMFTGATTAHLCTSVLYYINLNISPVPNFPWLIFVTITSYSIMTTAGLFPILYVLRGELFPQKIKALGNCLAALVGSITVFLISLNFLKIVELLGYSFIFFLFSIICVIGFIFVYLFVPETKGKTLPQIQMLLELQPNTS